MIHKRKVFKLVNKWDENGTEISIYLSKKKELLNMIKERKG